jgi:hypothetical protein
MLRGLKNGLPMRAKIIPHLSDDSFFTTNGATSLLSKICTEKPTSSVLLSNPFTKDVLQSSWFRTSVHGVVLSAAVPSTGQAETSTKLELRLHPLR